MGAASMMAPYRIPRYHTNRTLAMMMVRQLRQPHLSLTRVYASQSDKSWGEIASDGVQLAKYGQC